MKLLVFSLSFLISMTSFSQTVGVKEYQMGAYEGYNIVHPLSYDSTYLIDNCGHIVNQWASTFSNSTFAEITEQGTIIRSFVDPNATSFLAGGAAGIIQEHDWNGNLLWQYTMSNNNVRLHHDIEILPNGNLLVIAWEKKNSLECIAAGRIPGTLATNEMWPTVIYELEIVYPSSANIVWEWHAWDHLVQDYDTLANFYGNIQTNYDRIDVNKGNQYNGADWVHVNAIHYNVDLDHILLSAPMFDEIWMIDHGTTTSEAADSVGGNRGVGGDLLWRWGNPESYDKGNFSDQEFFFQHDCQWVEEGTRFEDHISVFDNRDTINGQLGSKVKIIRAEFDTLSNSYPMSNGKFLPLIPDYTYDLADTLFSPRVSGVQVLPNDHLLIASGSNGHVIEIDSNENLIWEYLLPIDDLGNIITQGDIIGLTKDIFKMKRYFPNYIGFSGLNLIPGDQIEINGNPCTTYLATTEIEDEKMLIYPNPANESIHITGLHLNEEIVIRDAVGRIVVTQNINEKVIELNCSHWDSGIYFVQSGVDCISFVVN